MTAPLTLFAPIPMIEEGGWPCIVADPPLRFATWSDKGQGRAPSRYYTDLTVEDIMTLPVETVAALDAWLFLWTTGPHLESAFRIRPAWGFQYSGIGFWWLKLRKGLCAGPRLVSTADLEREFFVGLGQTTRHNVELCLPGSRGGPPRLSKAVREVIIEAPREHSRKPGVIGASRRSAPPRASNCSGERRARAGRPGRPDDQVRSVAFG